MPTESSFEWIGPTSVPASCVIRAIAVESNALPSRALTLNYYIGESYSLPVLSIVSDNKTAFYGMYNVGWKDLEWGGCISWYEDGGSFSVPCGISMHGDTSLTMRKKNLSIRFRGSYGQQELNYDLFGGGITSFTNLVVRGGQDQNASIIRNELCENLALAASDHVVSSRSRYCVMFLDGKYSGIYALSEKLNEQRDFNLSTRLERCRFGRVGRRIAGEARIGFRDFQFHEERRFNVEDLPLIGVDRAFHILLNELEVVAQDTLVDRLKLIGLRIHEVIKIAVCITVLHAHSVNGRILKLRSRVKRSFGQMSTV